jgi:hypothetical protein
MVSVRSNFILEQHSHDLFGNTTRRAHLIGVSALNELNKANYSNTTL